MLTPDQAYGKLGNCIDVPAHVHATCPVACVEFDRPASWS